MLRAVIAGYTSQLAPGSSLVITCASLDRDELAKQLAAEYTPLVNVIPGYGSFVAPAGEPGDQPQGQRGQ